MSKPPVQDHDRCAAVNEEHLGSHKMTLERYRNQRFSRVLFLFALDARSDKNGHG